MKRLVFSLMFGACLLTAQTVMAQTAVPTSRLGWDQAAVTPAEASGYTYRYYPDGAVGGTTVSSVACTGVSSPFNCSISFPAFTPGSHTLQLTAANVAGESVKSASFAFVFVVVPAAPTGLRIQ